MMAMSSVLAEISATKVAFAALRQALNCALQPKAASKSRHIGEAEGRSNELRFLDVLYSSHTGAALRALDDYTEQRDAGKNPEFKASKIGLTQKLDYWQD